MASFNPDYGGNFQDGPAGGTPLTGGVFTNIEHQYAAAMADTAALYGKDVRPWAPNTQYAAGQAVVNPGGDIALAQTPHTSGASYTPGTWSQRLSVRAFGAKGDGVTDDTAAFSAAITYANTLNPSGTGAANVVGVTLVIPDGRYVINGPVQAILRPGVELVGASVDGAVLLLSYNGAAFTWGDASNIPIGGGISHVKVEYPANPGTSACLVNVYQASRLRFDDILLVNVGRVATLGASASLTASAITFSNVRGYVFNGGVPAFDLYYGAALYLDAVRIFVGGVNAPTPNRTSTMTTVAGSSVVNIGAGGSWDTVQIAGCFFERFDYGLQVAAPAGVIVNDIFISNTYFDYIATSVVNLQAQSSSSGGIFTVAISNTWLACWQDAAVKLNGPGPVRGVQITNCYIPSAGTHGILANAGATELLISNTKIDGTNRTNLNAMGIELNGSSHVTIANCIAGYDSTWAGFPWQAYNGLYVVAGTDNYTVIGNDFAGTAGGITVDTNATGSKARYVTKNRGANYAGNAAITLPASGSAWVNTTPFDVEVSLYGGTVTGIAKNGTTIAGMTAGTVRLAPGESLTVTYSVAPSTTLFAQP